MSIGSLLLRMAGKDPDSKARAVAVTGKGEIKTQSVASRVIDGFTSVNIPAGESLAVTGVRIDGHSVCFALRATGGVTAKLSLTAYGDNSSNFPYERIQSRDDNVVHFETNMSGLQIIPVYNEMNEIIITNERDDDLVINYLVMTTYY